MNFNVRNPYLVVATNNFKMTKKIKTRKYKIIIIIKIVLIIISFFNEITCVNQAAKSNLLEEYDSKVMKGEETCDYVNRVNLPQDKRTLLGRSCLCDEQCAEYRDCCKDSAFYDVMEQSSLSTYHCSEYAGVYMLTECPAGFNDTTVIELCKKSTKVPESNISLAVPLSNTLTRITYGNRYCAMCHNEDLESLTVWDIGTVCGKASYGYLKNFTWPSTTVSPFFYFRKNTRKPFVDYATYQAENHIISSYAEYDFIDKEFVSRYNDSAFVCKFEAVLPENYSDFARICIPFVTERCPENYQNQSLAKECSSYTNIVYNKNTYKPYRNEKCALCWNEKENDIDGLPRDIRNSTLLNALYTPTGGGNFHVRPTHGFSYSVIVPPSVGVIHRVKPNSLFKPSI